MQSLARSQQSVATSAAAAAAAAQVAAAAGVNPMQIMEHPRLIFQPTAAAALGVGGKKYFWYSIIFDVLNAPYSTTSLDLKPVFQTISLTVPCGQSIQFQYQYIPPIQESFCHRVTLLN